jgi:hypothetical protein
MAKSRGHNQAGRLSSGGFLALGFKQIPDDDDVLYKYAVPEAL